MDKPRAPRNRTQFLTANDEKRYGKRLLQLTTRVRAEDVLNRTIHQDMMGAIDFLPDHFVNLLILDPPYNLAKSFSNRSFSKHKVSDYTNWMFQWFEPLLRLLSSDASIYICGDWLTSASIYSVISQQVKVRNRITWEREKGRGAKRNWKNCSEDIWFATVGNQYCFNADVVRLKRNVIAPYRVAGKPKDWMEQPEGNFRLTYPSNLWSDITVPFWSMPENTDHPTQKPEKLIAKLVLGSSREGDVILDPFLGSGTTSVVAKKLRRAFVGIEIDHTFCCLAEKRLEAADSDPSIQGYSDGVFWERNTLNKQKQAGVQSPAPQKMGSTLF